MVSLNWKRKTQTGTNEDEDTFKTKKVNLSVLVGQLLRSPQSGGSAEQRAPPSLVNAVGPQDAETDAEKRQGPAELLIVWGLQNEYDALN